MTSDFWTTEWFFKINETNLFFSFLEFRSTLLRKGSKEEQSASLSVPEWDRHFGKQNQGVRQIIAEQVILTMDPVLTIFLFLSSSCTRATSPPSPSVLSFSLHPKYLALWPGTLQQTRSTVISSRARSLWVFPSQTLKNYFGDVGRVVQKIVATNQWINDTFRLLASHMFVSLNHFSGWRAGLSYRGCLSRFKEGRDNQGRTRHDSWGAPT